MRIRAVAGLLLAAAAACSGATAARDPWQALHRPLHLPKLAAGAQCPVSKVDRRVAWERAHIYGGQGIGPGPVYPGLPNGFFMGLRDDQYGGPWFGSKVFWYVRPSYRGPALLRGRRLDGPGRVGFNGGKVAGRELRIAPGQTVAWSGQPSGSRGVPSDVRVLTPGCYGIQIDGTSFSRIVVVSVDVAS